MTALLIVLLGVLSNAILLPFLILIFGGIQLLLNIILKRNGNFTIGSYAVGYTNLNLQLILGRLICDLRAVDFSWYWAIVLFAVTITINGYTWNDTPGEDPRRLIMGYISGSTICIIVYFIRPLL